MIMSDKQKGKKRQENAVDHATASRWIQEEILKQIPELGYVSERLIERILRLEHKFYIQKGCTSIRYVDELKDKENK
jgi:hypothetical protein